MFSKVKDVMFSVGYITVALYLLAFTFFFLGMFYYATFLIAGFAIGALFFLAASAIVGIMVKKRVGT